MGLLRGYCDVLASDQLDEHALATPGRRVLVTVDDCYRDSYEVAFPVFADNRVPATFFLASGFLDGTATPWWDEIAWMVTVSNRERLEPATWWSKALPLQGAAARPTVTELVRVRRGLDPVRGTDMLERLADATGSGRRPAESTAEEFITWEHAREMAAAGMTIGGHTDTHPVLSTLSEQGQRAEIVRGLDRIAAELGERPTTFAYPVGLQGTFDSSTKRALAANGVRLAFSNYGGYSRRSNWEPLEIRRVGVSQETTEAAFRWTVGLPAVFASEWPPGQFQLHAGD
jgi:peptidoglycan/xylan/chitin deacetylase (PgdA/CDA1 family)